MVVQFRFHSISFPNEWGRIYGFLHGHSQTTVSIQLVSPTSGDMDGSTFAAELALDSPSFHSISFPNEWGRLPRLLSSKPGGFHSISFPNEWGEFHHTPHTTQCVQRRFLPALAKLPDRPPPHPIH